MGFLHPVSIISNMNIFHVFLKATYGKAYFVWSFKTVFKQVKHQARVPIILSHSNCGSDGKVNTYMPSSISHICCNIRDAGATKTQVNSYETTLVWLWEDEHFSCYMNVSIWLRSNHKLSLKIIYSCVALPIYTQS